MHWNGLKQPWCMIEHSYASIRARLSKVLCHILEATFGNISIQSYNMGSQHPFAATSWDGLVTRFLLKFGMESTRNRLTGWNVGFLPHRISTSTWRQQQIENRQQLPLLLVVGFCHHTNLQGIRLGRRYKPLLACLLLVACSSLVTLLL